VVAKAETLGFREDVGSGSLRKGGIEFEDTNKLSVATNFALFRQTSVADSNKGLQDALVTSRRTKHKAKSTRGLHPTPLSHPGVGTPASPKAVTYPKGLVDTQLPAVPDAHPVVSAQSQLRTCEDARP